MGFLLHWAVFSVLLAGVVYLYSDVKHFEAKVVHLAPVQEFVGALAPKKLAGKVEYILKGKLQGPECIVLHKDAIYTGTLDGKIVKIVNNKIVKELRIANDPLCGGFSSFLSIEWFLDLYLQRRCTARGRWECAGGKTRKIVVADAQLGILVADFASGEVRQVISSKTYVGGLGQSVPGRPRDHRRTAIYSDMTSKCGEDKFGLCFLEMAEDGRLIKVNLNTGAFEVVADKIVSPNGVMLHPDKDSVLVTQCILSRLIRVYFKGPKKGKVEVIADGLPGIVDNIREAPNGKTFWLAMPHAADQKWRPLGQMLSEWPTVRHALAYLPEKFRMALLGVGSPKYNVLIEMDFDGKIVNSIHDPNNELDWVTHIEESADGFLYLGSYVKDSIRRIKKL
ncbi:Adipocyte plasma membrane-associated protein [Aphelenchoides fujianensis]|nr:Adipocyte plasma membrane-associated protein [Aphelenchoides fujianensis]